MKLKEINKGSQKTKYLIKITLAELVDEKKEIAKISVTELTHRANISRGTFYCHYDNIYDVIQEMEDELQGFAFTGLAKASSFEEFIDILFDYIETQEDLYTKLLKSNEPILIMNRLSKKFINALKEFIHSDDIYIDLKLNFLTEGAAVLLIKYFRGEIIFSLKDIRNFLKEIYKRVIA